MGLEGSLDWMVSSWLDRGDIADGADAIVTDRAIGTSEAAGHNAVAYDVGEAQRCAHGPGYVVSCMEVGWHRLEAAKVP